MNVISRIKNVLPIFILMVLFCSNQKLLSINQEELNQSSSKLLFNDQEKKYIQIYPEEELAYIPSEVSLQLKSIFEKNPNILTDPSFSHVNENLQNSLRFARYSEIEKVISELNEDSLNDYSQQLQTGDALIDITINEPIKKGGCCNPCRINGSCKLILNKPTLSALQIIQLLEALQALQGPNSEIILQGLQGIPGLQGIQGIPGIQGFIGLQGIPGIPGISGLPGLIGLQGIQGPQGTNGIDGVISSAQYVQLGSQPATVAAGQPFTYTTSILTTPGITAQTGVIGSFTASGTVFTLANVGRYEINYQMTITENGGVVIYAGPTTDGMLPLPYTMIGKTPDGQMSGSVIVETTTENSFLSINAAPGNSVALTVPPNSSTTNQSATTVSFKQIS